MSILASKEFIHNGTTHIAIIRHNTSCSNRLVFEVRLIDGADTDRYVDQSFIRDDWTIDRTFGLINFMGVGNALIARLLKLKAFL